MQREGEAEVGVQAPLVKLVEDDEPDAIEPRICREQPGQHPFGDDLDAGGGSYARVATDPVADGSADRLIKLASHPPRRGASGEPPRLEHHDAPAAQPRLVEQRERHPGGLTRARRRLQHSRPAVAEGIAQCRQRRIDRKRVTRHRPETYRRDLPSSAEAR